MTDQTKRVRPCDACRRRKTRCVTEDGATTCVLCKFHKQQCSYNELPAPRKRTASRDDGSPEMPLPKRRKPIKTRPGTGMEEYDALPDGTTLLKRTLGLQNLHHSRYIGPSDVLDVYGATIPYGGDLIASSNVSQAATRVRFVHPLHAFQISPDSETPGHAEEASVLDEIENAVYGHGPELVRLYFRVVHPAFPILHKEVFLEKYSRSYREFSPPLLSAVYLLASGYWAFSDSLSAQPKPDLAPLLRLAKNSLQSTLQRAKLSTIQAGLLISQFQSSVAEKTSSDPSRHLTAQLVELSYQLGLHLDAGDWDIPAWEIGLRRRLSWAVFMQDKWIALFAGRSPLVTGEFWKVAPLTMGDFPETVEDETAGSSEVEKGRLVFMHMAELSVILEAVLRILSSSHAMQQPTHGFHNDLLGLLDRIKPVQIRLKEWFTLLPDSLRMDSPASMKLSSVGYLRLAYLTVEICVHRQIMKAMLRDQGQDNTLTIVCQSAATERFTNAIDFMRRLQAQHLASFWYFTSAQCCASVYSFGRMLMESSTDADTKTSFDQQLKAFRWSLKVNSEAGASFMKHALAFIEMASRISFISSGDRSVTTSPAAFRDSGALSSTQVQLWSNHDGQQDLADLTHTTFEMFQQDGDAFTGDAWAFDATAENWLYDGHGVDVSVFEAQPTGLSGHSGTTPHEPP